MSTAAALDSTGRAGAASEETWLADAVDDRLQPDGVVEVDRKLATLCRERGPLRAVLARIASRLVIVRVWERIGHARLSDYAVERLGLSARWVRSLALVGEAFRVFPRLEDELVAGTLGWTKVRLLASLPRGEDEAGWIARARHVTAEELSKMVRAVDRGSLEAGVLDADEATVRCGVLEVRCSPEVRWKWHAATRAASRAAGRMLHIAEAAELIAAEVLSAMPVDEPSEQAGRDDTDASWCPSTSCADDTAGSEPLGVTRATWEGYGALQELLVGLEQADAFELDDRFRRALSIEQCLDARIGPLLTLVWNRRMPRLLGYRIREDYARERLGMDPTRARALVRLERAAAASEPFARAYRSGGLSWVKAGLLVPLVSADPLGRFMKDWVVWAGRVTVRRLRDDVEWALALADTDPAAFRQTGGLPSEARDEREIRAAQKHPVGHTVPMSEREIGAPEKEAAETCSVRFFGPADVVQLFRAVLCSVRRRIEPDVGRLPTEGQALGAMLDHVLASWGVHGGKVAARHRVFDRDGWRCAVPGCTSMQNLHDHHIRFRSAGGSDAPENRVTLCAFHHLRGVHAERLGCLGRAPDGLTWHMGIRPGVAPLITYRSGDLQV